MSESVKAVQRLYQNPNFLNALRSKEGESSADVIRLYDYIVSRVFHLMSEDFKVLYIAPQTRFGQKEQRFFMKNHKANPLSAAVEYTHYVVLEIDGFIIDPKFSLELGPLPREEYLRRRFQDSNFDSSHIARVEDMIFYEIPGPNYLHELDYSMLLDLHQQKVVSKFSQRPLRTYLLLDAEESFSQ